MSILSSPSMYNHDFLIVRFTNVRSYTRGQINCHWLTDTETLNVNNTLLILYLCNFVRRHQVVLFCMHFLFVSFVQKMCIFVLNDTHAYIQSCSHSLSISAVYRSTIIHYSNFMNSFPPKKNTTHSIRLVACRNFSHQIIVQMEIETKIFPVKSWPIQYKFRNTIDTVCTMWTFWHQCCI